MIEEFLKAYDHAVSLDGEQYNSYFPEGVDRADFLLFNSQVICEVKKIKDVQVQHQVEKLACKGDKNFKRDFYNSINQALSKANRQIKESKQALGYSGALGLVVLENLIENDLSVLSLIDASDRKMLGGLAHVDVVLCLDMVNAFSNNEGEYVRPVPVVIRDTERARKLSELLQNLVSDFYDQPEIPFYDGAPVSAIEQIWSIDQDGKYQEYKAKFDFQSFEPETKANWRKRLAQFLNRWWWVILLPAILYDWFID